MIKRSLIKQSLLKRSFLKRSLVLGALRLPVVILLVSCTAAVAKRNEKGETVLDTRFTVTEFDTLPENRGLHRKHYPISNEARIDLYMDQIRDVGGGLVGVGTDQNLCFVAWAKSVPALADKQ